MGPDCRGQGLYPRVLRFDLALSGNKCGRSTVPQEMMETERLKVRLIDEDDTEALLEIFSDPIAMQYFGVIFDRAMMDKWVRSNLNHQTEHGFSLYAVILKESGKFIGDCGLETDTIENKLITGIGFDFNRAYWGKGYATEAARAVLRYGFASFDFSSIYGWIDPENTASRRVAERIGMTRERFALRGPKRYALYRIDRP